MFDDFFTQIQSDELECESENFENAFKNEAEGKDAEWIESMTDEIGGFDTIESAVSHSPFWHDFTQINMDDIPF